VTILWLSSYHLSTTPLVTGHPRTLIPQQKLPTISQPVHDPSVISTPRPLDWTAVHGQPTGALLSARGLFLLFKVRITGLLSASVFGLVIVRDGGLLFYRIT
jgi:hypothetical protein